MTGMPLVRPLFFANENDNVSNMCDEYFWDFRFLSPRFSRPVKHREVSIYRRERG